MFPKLPIAIKKLRDDALVPEYKTPGAAGFDIVAVDEEVVLPGKTILVHTGLAMAIPEGFELQIRPRSGIAYNTELVVKNSPGTVDSDYRGEIMVMVKNTNPATIHHVRAGDRIAQGIIAPVLQCEFEVVDELPETVRGNGGFGSTGTTEAA